LEQFGDAGGVHGLCLREFQGYELRKLRSRVGYCVRVVAGEPFGVAGLEVAGHGALRTFFIVAMDIAADVEVGDGDQEMRAGVVMHGHDGTGLEFEFGDADGVFDEEDLLGATLESDEGAVFIPIGMGVTERIVLEDFDGDVAEGLIGNVAGDVGEGGWGEAGFAILELEGNGRLVFHSVDDLGVSESDVDVIVTVPVHESFGARRNVDVEDSGGFVFEGEVVVGLGGDFDFGGGCLRREQCEADEEATGHAAEL
jgi:hypothetical protein